MKTTNLNVGHRKRLRNKFLRHGEDVFYDYEMLELLLTYAIPFKDVKPIAKELLLNFSSVREVMDARVEELCKVKGIKENSAVLIKLIKAMGSLYLYTKIKESKKLENLQDIIDFIRIKISCLKFESVMLIYLNSSRGLIDYEVLSYGSFDKINIDGQYVIRNCYRFNAKFVIISHNHPSGICEPSNQDLLFTKALKKALDANGMILVDHLIVTNNSSYSMNRNKVPFDNWYQF